MADIPPSLPNARIIRVYPNDYAQSDTESEGDAQYEEVTEGGEQQSISARLQQNQLYMDQQIAPPSGESSWILVPQSWTTTEGSPVILIRRPTASNLSHFLLNPFIYRSIQAVDTLYDLAGLLDAPDDWEERCNSIVTDGYIIRALNRFRDMADDTAECNIRFGFLALITFIAHRLHIDLDSHIETKIIVGGILARYQYDLPSKSDLRFLDANSQNLIACQVKTHRSFGPGEMWYHYSRGVQVLSALYAFNCPTFLFTHRQWKLFVENTERNAIFTFPYNDNPEHTPHVNSSLVHPMGTTFLKAIAICLLSRRVSLNITMKSPTLQASSLDKDTPQKTVIPQKLVESPERPVYINARPEPSFMSGYDGEGHPIYSMVRVASAETVSKIESDII
jgi:hypothetical protein